MTDSTRRLEKAASAIDAGALEAAKLTITECCEEWLRLAKILSKRLETVAPEDLHKFARALALTMLGQLPTRPNTCPFCIQYGKDRSCGGCGYAVTHGRCDSDASAFSLFIEAFQELGRAIYQDTEGLKVEPYEARNALLQSICASTRRTEQMLEDISSASALDLMELKASYLDEMIGLIPWKLLSFEVEERAKGARERLKDYW
jgi:hypothetical protein